MFANNAAFAYYTAITAIVLMDVVMLSFIAARNTFLQRRTKRRFGTAFGLIFAAAIFEWSAAYVQLVSTDLILLHKILKACELITVPAICLWFMLAIKTRKELVRAAIGATAVNAILVVVSLFNGLVFYVDTFNVYHHGFLYWTYIACYFFAAICVFVATILFLRNQYSRSILDAVLLISFFAVGYLILRVLDVKGDYLVIAVLFNLFYLEYLDVLQGVDNLTKLRNRHSYDTMVSTINRPSVIVSLDIDDFKLCNDNFGHLFGDKVLRIVGRTLRTCSPHGAVCYRTGGDEFAVFLRNGEAEATRMIAAIHEELARQRSTEPCLPDVSCGYAAFDPQRNSIVEAIEAADAMMYEQKNRRKQEAALTDL